MTDEAEQTEANLSAKVCGGVSLHSVPYPPLTLCFSPPDNTSFHSLRVSRPPSLDGK